MNTNKFVPVLAIIAVGLSAALALNTATPLHKKPSTSVLAQPIYK